MATLILLRHGQSVWNAANKFTGWTDVELSEKGEIEAATAGEQLADASFKRTWMIDGPEPVMSGSVSYTHLTLPTNREV